MAKTLKVKYDTEVRVDSMGIEVLLSGHKKYNVEAIVDVMTAEISDIVITPLTYIVTLDYDFVTDLSGNTIIGMGEL